MARDGILFNKSATTLLYYPVAKAGNSYTIPDGVTTISQGAFLDSSLASVAIPNSVTSIQSNVFQGCANLTMLSIPGGVTSIPDDMCMNCAALSAITLPPGITSIGDFAFYGTALASVNMPDALISIGNFVFAGCPLSALTLGKNVTTVGSGAFEGCTISALNLDTHLTIIGAEAFSGCGNLSFVIIPASVTRIGDQAFAPSRQVTDTYLDEYQLDGLTKARFLGNAPSMGQDVFSAYDSPHGYYVAMPGFTVYYNAGATGFATPTWTIGGASYPTVELDQTEFSEWQDSNGLTGSASDTPLHDGVPNLLKYFCDIDPTQTVGASVAQLPVGGMQEINQAPMMTLTYHQYEGATGLTVHVQTSTDMQTWTEVFNPTIVTLGIENNNDLIQQAQVPVTNSTQFMRLQISAP